MFLGTGSMVACLKHVGITDSDRERLKMSVKPVGQRMLTCLGNSSGPVAL